MYLHTLILLCLETEVLFCHEFTCMRMACGWNWAFCEYMCMWNCGWRVPRKPGLWYNLWTMTAWPQCFLFFLKFWDLHHFSLSCGNIVRGFQSTCLYWRESPWMLKEKCQSSQLTWCLLTRYLHSWAVMSPSCKLNESDQVEGCRLLLTWGTIPISEAIFKPDF